jgi:hypothetical protein
MTEVTTGLPNNGRTRYFNLQYDDALSVTRGKDLAAELMTHCDDDLSLVAGWFSGRQLDMSPPINVSLTTVATDSVGNPADYVGGKWTGALAWPLQVTINIGEFDMLSGTPIMLARYLLVAEVSEMYMRAFYLDGPNPWFRFSEGNKGEGLSRFLSTQFLLRAYPDVAAVPSLLYPAGAGLWNVTNQWLDSVRANWLEVNDEDIYPDPETGCATLFLFWLHDQLGYSIEAIVNAGAGHLSNVYENLAHDSWTNAWPKFSDVVNVHYPHALVGGGFEPSYSPPLETVFPVPELVRFSATGQVSWVPVPTRIQPVLEVAFDRPTSVDVSIDLSSSDPTTVAVSSPVTMRASTQAQASSLRVLPQPASFTSKNVTLTASYAGRTLHTSVHVLSPDAVGLPALVIDVDRSADPCHPLFLEGDTQVFRINNLHVFADQTDLVFSWTVDGAMPDATDGETLTVETLPAAGTEVTVRVTVENEPGLHAAGEFTFDTRAVSPEVLDEELRCRLGRFRNQSLSIQPWEPVEVENRRELLETLQLQVHQVSVLAAEVTKSIRTTIERE